MFYYFFFNTFLFISTLIFNDHCAYHLSLFMVDLRFGTFVVPLRPANHRLSLLPLSSLLFWECLGIRTATW